MKTWVDSSLDLIGWGPYQRKLLWCAFQSIGISISFALALPILVQTLYQLTNTQKGILAGILNGGMLISAGAMAQTSEKHGRVKIFQQSGYMLLLGLIMMSSAYSIQTITLALFTLGIGIGAQMSVVHTILKQSVPTNTRQQASQWSVTSINIIGVAIFAFATLYEYFEYEGAPIWKMIAVALTVVRLIGVLPRRDIQESPVYLNGVGKTDKAKEVLASIAKYNEKKFNQNQAVDQAGPKPTKPRFGQVFKKPYGGKTFILVVIYFFCFAAFEGCIVFFPVLVKTESSVVKFGSLCLFYLLGFVGKYLGKKMMKIGVKNSTILGFFAVSACVYSMNSAVSGTAILVLASLFSLSYNAATVGLFQMTNLLYDSNIRNLAVGFQMGFSRLASTLSVMATGYALDHFGLEMTLTAMSTCFSLAALSSMLISFGPKPKTN